MTILYKVWWMDRLTFVWRREAFIQLGEANTFADLLIEGGGSTNIFMTK